MVDVPYFTIKSYSKSSACLQTENSKKIIVVDVPYSLLFTFDKDRKEKTLKMKQKNLESNGVEYTSTWEISLCVSQIKVKFYRWLRIYATKNTSWNEAIANLGVLYATF